MLCHNQTQTNVKVRLKHHLGVINLLSWKEKIIIVPIVYMQIVGFPLYQKT